MAKERFPPETLQKIRESISLADVIGEHVVLRKSGGSANYMGLCPFHSERSPSFSVNDQKQLYFCYGCKKGGDLFSFVMEIHGLSFHEAIEELAERGNVALPKSYAGEATNDPEADKRRAAQREKLALAYKVNRFVAAYYRGNLATHSAAVEYFRKRGVTPELERAFYLGASFPGWDGLAHHLHAKKAPMELAAELGLIRPSTKGNAGASGHFDLFRNRAMFPILDMRGRVAGFGGRSMPNPSNEGNDDGPKYLNSPESLIFHKSKLAYGLYQAQKHAREKDEIILVEGYFDVLALHAAGFENAVATCGTSLTPDHLAIFKRIASRVVLLFDGDKAGINATERAMEVGIEQGQVLFGVTIPGGQDPDEFLFDQQSAKPKPEGQAELKKLIEEAKPLLDVRIEEAIHDARSGPEARTQAIKKIAGWLSKFKDPIGKDVRVEAVVSKLGVQRQLLERAMNPNQPYTPQAAAPRPQSRPPYQQHQQQQQNYPQQRPMGPPQGAPRSRSQQGSKKADKLSEFEKILLSSIAIGGEFTQILVDARRHLPPVMSLSDLFTYPPAKTFVAALVEVPGFFERLRQTPETVLQEIEDDQVRSTLMEALVSTHMRVTTQDVRLAAARMIEYAWAQFSHRIMADLAGAEAKQDGELQAKLMQEYLDVQRKMKELSSFYDEA